MARRQPLNEAFDRRKAAIAVAISEPYHFTLRRPPLGELTEELNVKLCRPLKSGECHFHIADHPHQVATVIDIGSDIDVPKQILMLDLVGNGHDRNVSSVGYVHQSTGWLSVRRFCMSVRL